jgi:hypothetical protein
MTLTRLLTATLVACSALAIAQQKNEAPAIPAQATDASKPPTAASSEPWKFIPNQLADASSGKDPLDRLQIDKYKVFRSKTNTRTLLLGPEADAGMVLSGLGGDLDGVTTCLKIRSYVVARDSKDSDSTHLVSYSTCQPSTRYRVRTTEIRSGSVDR